MSHADKISRRNFLAAAGAATVAACAPPSSDFQESPAQSTAPKERNIYAALKKFGVTDQNGNPVNVTALQQKYKAKFSTLTFSFNGCTQYCPLTNFSLRRMDREGPAVTHFIVSVRPEEDGMSQVARDQFMRTFREQMKIPGDLQLLYPKSGKDAIAMQNEMNLILNQEDPTAHSGQILLFAPDGAMAGKKSGVVQDNFDDWKQLIETYRAR